MNKTGRQCPREMIRLPLSKEDPGVKAGSLPRPSLLPCSQPMAFPLCRCPLGSRTTARPPGGSRSTGSWRRCPPPRPAAGRHPSLGGGVGAEAWPKVGTKVTIARKGMGSKQENNQGPCFFRNKQPIEAIVGIFEHYEFGFSCKQNCIIRWMKLNNR